MAKAVLMILEEVTIHGIVSIKRLVVKVIPNQKFVKLIMK